MAIFWVMHLKRPIIHTCFLHGLAVWLIFDAFVSHADAAETRTERFRAAYQHWTIVCQNCILDIPFQARPGGREPRLAGAIQNMIDFGPNGLIDLVEIYRKEMDWQQLLRISVLLQPLAGMDLGRERYRPGTPEELQLRYQEVRDDFLRRWDGGWFWNSDHALRQHWDKLPPEVQQPTSQPWFLQDELTEFRRYGVFALPLLVEKVLAENSTRAFAGFLIITDHPTLFADYWKAGSSRFTTVEEKKAFMDDWLRKNDARLSDLGNLNQRLRLALVKKPLPLQTAPGTQASAPASQPPAAVAIAPPTPPPAAPVSGTTLHTLDLVQPLNSSHQRETPQSKPWDWRTLCVSVIVGIAILALGRWLLIRKRKIAGD